MRTRALAGVLMLFQAAQVLGQIPGLPAMSKASAGGKEKNASKEQEKPAAAPTKDNAQATVATPPGPISVEKPVDDGTLQDTLETLLPKYPGVREVKVAVNNGVVTLEGQVENDDVRDNLTQFTRRVEGVRLVLNRMKTDAQVLTASQLAEKVLREIGENVQRNWLLVLLSLAIVLVFLGLARVFGAHSETLLAPFIGNVLLRSVVGSLLSSTVIVGGVLMALSVLGLTQAVLSVLGLAGVVGLAVGFAFRDIAENFIASILLGLRKPFRIGDYIEVAGQAGVVLSLNTRATVLVTLDGKHIRIPNTIIYKEILINSSASPTSRGSFDVVIPYEVSTAKALEAMAKALHEQEEVLPDPPPRALVEALEPAGVRLRAYFWMPVKGTDGLKLTSDVKLRVKVGLQQAGITPPPDSMMVSVVGSVPVQLSESKGEPKADTVVPCAIVTPEQAKANLQRDSRAAERATGAPAGNRPTPVEHALEQAQAHASEEGTNLLKESANGK